jgi:hypothetical protein
MTMAMVDNKWVSFAWDLKRRQLTIHDASNKLDKWESHKIVATILNSALRKCIAAYFDGWNVDLGRWATVYTSASSRGDDKENRLGLQQCFCTQLKTLPILEGQHTFYDTDGLLLFFMDQLP